MDYTSPRQMQRSFPRNMQRSSPRKFCLLYVRLKDLLALCTRFLVDDVAGLRIHAPEQRQMRNPVAITGSYGGPHAIGIGPAVRRAYWPNRPTDGIKAPFLLKISFFSAPISPKSFPTAPTGPKNLLFTLKKQCLILYCLIRQFVKIKYPFKVNSSKYGISRESEIRIGI
jgi:hypothetical protein